MITFDEVLNLNYSALINVNRIYSNAPNVK